MRIQTVYKDGVLKPVKPLRLKRQMVTISIPDEDIAEEAQLESNKTAFEPYTLSSEARAYAESLVARLTAVRERPFAAGKREITEKQQERWEAFDLRAALREEEGRPE